MTPSNVCEISQKGALMSEPKKPRRSRANSNGNSDSAANLPFEGDSSNAYNWRQKYMANVHSSNSKSSLQKQKERGSQIGTFVVPPSADSEK